MGANWTSTREGNGLSHAAGLECRVKKFGNAQKPTTTLSSLSRPEKPLATQGLKTASSTEILRVQ
jgi:hypothetical protein